MANHARRGYDSQMNTRRVKVVLRMGFALLATVGATRADPGDHPPVPTAQEIEAAVNRLSDFDPIVRRDAASRLSEIGFPARAALGVASRSGDLELRSQASRLLLQLPWTSPADPQPVQQLLDEYERKEVEARREIAGKLFTLENGQGNDAILRLLRDEVSSIVRWEIVRRVRTGVWSAEAPLYVQLRKATRQPASLAATDAPLAAAGAWAWLRAGSTEDLNLAAQLMQAAIESEQNESSDAGANLDFAYDFLLKQATARKDFPAAATLLRGRVSGANGSTDPVVLNSLARLLMLHHTDPSVGGLEQDLALAQLYDTSAEVKYAVGRLKVLNGEVDAGKDLIAGAFAMSEGNLEARSRVGDFLYDLRWYDLAEPELLDALKLDGPNVPMHRGNARFRLANIAASRGEEGAIADHLAAALEVIGDQQGMTINGGSVDGVRASIEWHRLRDAEKRGDDAAAKRSLDALLKTTPDSPELLLDVMPQLQQAGRDAEAKQFFERSYGAVKDQLANKPDSSAKMNTLAWLLARCNQRLDEAFDLATHATRLEPNNPAYLDTLAEVQFQKGNVAEAIRLEERALSLLPGDAFTTEQLARFKGATTQPKMEK